MQTKRVEKKISQIMPGLGIEEDVIVSGIQMDSRLIKEGELFLAVPGSETDGRLYIDTAIANGAAAVLYESGWKESLIESSVPMLGVEKLSARTGDIASRFFDEPSRKMDVIAVTGTNGKTSCSHFIATSLSALGDKCGVIGTLGYGFPPDLLPFGLTTPDAIQMQKFLFDINLQEAQAVAVEASSHGLAQGRLNGTQAKIAVLTNLTRDHLDYHHDLDRYKSSKRILFEMPSVELVVLNRDDPFGLELEQSLSVKTQKIIYSLEDKSADVFCENMTFHEKGMSSQVTTPWGFGVLKSPLYGRFNLSNLLAVLCVLGAKGYKLECILSTMADIKNVKGRMDRFAHQGCATVVIDYAHTPDALDKALLAIREHCSGKLWCVFGCGGNRDRGKRPEMGAIAGRLSDYLILTDDNPRQEDSQKIIEEIMAGVAETDKVHVDSNRARAIQYAVDEADINDVVLIAGKGHEDYQDIGGVKKPFSDYEQVERALELRLAPSALGRQAKVREHSGIVSEMVIGKKKVIIGLGSTGYSCARYFKSRDIPFEVVDQDRSPLLLKSFKQELPGVTVTTGKLDQKMLLLADEMVVSPGVPLATDEIRKAVAAGIKVTGDIDIFSHVVAKPVIAITGSNGKSTVTTMVGQMAKASGIETAIGGNLGIPALDLLSPDNDLYVLEVSSFQLETAEVLAAQVAVVLNLSPDHLDRYSSEHHYYTTKGRIFQGCKHAVINRDQAFQFDIAESTTIWSFGADAPASENELGLVNRGGQTYLTWGTQRLLSGEDLNIKGKHNYLNALAGLAIGLAAGFPLDVMLKTVSKFNGLSHRCEWVACIDGVDCFDDSKATNVGAAVAAINGLGETSTGRIVLIAGGVAKGADFTPLREPVKAHVQSVILMGQDADSIGAALKGVVPVQRAVDLTEAIDFAFQQSNKGDMVLLSPACASLDMFKNFEQRGDHFKKLIAERG